MLRILFIRTKLHPACRPLSMAGDRVQFLFCLMIIFLLRLQRYPLHTFLAQNTVPQTVSAGTRTVSWIMIRIVIIGAYVV